MIPTEESLYGYLSAYAAQCPNKKLLGGSTGWLTVEEVFEAAQNIASRLGRIGIQRDMLIALRAEHCVGTALTILGLRFLGAVVVLTPPQIPSMKAIAHSETAIPVEHCLEIEGGTLCIDGSQRLELLMQGKADISMPEPSLKSAGFIIFTSGSTGKCKAVMLSEYNLVNNLLDSESLGAYSEQDIALGALPLDHVFGLVLLCGTMVLRHALYFPENADIPGILKAIEDEHITRMNGVPSLYLAMADQKDTFDIGSLRAGFIGGGPCTPEQFQYIEEKLDMTLIPVYGMSECIGISCASYQDTQQSRASGVGPFYSMNTGRILREDGSEAAIGEEGEICVDGPSRMVGYYGDTSPRSKLLHTGDLGSVDEKGILHISGRKKDIIIRNGLNLSARKIEEAILSIPAVQAVCVVGLPHEQLGEAPYAMVVSDSPETSLWEELRHVLQKNELPLGILCTADIPMTHTGKPDKQRIRERLLQGYQTDVTATQKRSNRKEYREQK